MNEWMEKKRKKERKKEGREERKKEKKHGKKERKKERKKENLYFNNFSDRQKCQTLCKYVQIYLRKRIFINRNVDFYSFSKDFKALLSSFEHRFVSVQTC